MWILLKIVIENMQVTLEQIAISRQDGMYQLPSSH